MLKPMKSMTWLVLLLLLMSSQSLAQGDAGKIGRHLQRVLPGPDKTLATEQSFAVWVRFTDKDLRGADLETALERTRDRLDAHVLTRRGRAGIGVAAVDEGDLPVSSRYLDLVAATGAVPRQQSRWLNAGSFDATETQIQAMAALPCVRQLELVARGAGRKDDLSAEMPADLKAEMALAQAEKCLTTLDYGASLPGLVQVNAVAAHAMGLSGKGVTVAVLDTGFDLSHESLQDVEVTGTWDFVNGDANVGPRPGDDFFQTLYGTAALSILAGYSSSNLIGSAYGVNVLLAKTEDLKSETPAEEDNWIAAAEWAEEQGADIICSGLGYYEWYEFSDMDGYTAAITVAAEMATSRGVCVVNGVGDQRANLDWPHILPPSDGRGVIAVGGVDINNQVTWSSSPGPTADGRIKPDVLAMGSGHPAAVNRRGDLYNYSFGTNYAVPLVAGVVALMLESNPTLNPSQIMEALHETASRSVLPDNDYGWGLANAVAAIEYWAPKIVHTPLVDTEGGVGSYHVQANITDARGLDTDRLYVAYRVDGGNWILAPMVSDGGSSYIGVIPPQGRSGKQIDYYIAAFNSLGYASREPANAPDDFHSFVEGADTTPPVITHLPIANVTRAQWPPTIRVEARDNQAMQRVEITYSVPGLGSVGPLPMIDMGNDVYELELPTPVGSIFPGFTISYMIVATDVASLPNVAFVGPTTFDVVASRGRVLLVDDRNNTKSGAPSGRQTAKSAREFDKSASEVAQWLIEAGFTVDELAASAVKSSSFAGYDAVMVSSGGNYLPYAYPELRRTMVHWAERGGKLIVEGGETAYAVGVSPGYPELVGTVLPMREFYGDEFGPLRPVAALQDQPLLNRPNRLPDLMLVDNMNGNDWGATDLVMKSDDAFVVMHAGYGVNRGGVVAYDNNTGPDAGQTVYFTFNLAKLAVADARALLDNAMTYLLTTEPPGPATISGQVMLAGQAPRAGITVRAGLTHETVTAADGSYSLSGLWGGRYAVTVAEPGFAPSTHFITAVDDMVVADKNFYLIPITRVSYQSAPGLAIPDNDPVGISDVIEVAETGQVYGVNVDADIPHFSIGQLVVTVTSPSGVSVVLHNRTGGVNDDLVGNWPASLFVDGPGSLDDFVGESARGPWTLTVADNQLGALGSVDTWGLNLMVRNGEVSATAPTLPQATRLLGNTPNPFNPRTTIAFELAAAGRTRLDIYDLQGRLVRHLANRTFAAGRHELVWDGRDGSGAETASGLYFYRLQVSGHQETNKMLLVR